MSDLTAQATEAELERLRYPIGRFEATPTPLDAAQRARLIDEVARAPGDLRSAVEGLTDEQLDTRYRPGGWTLRQVVHHVPDSHLNSYVRFKLTSTEDVPTIRTYDEAAWGELDDARTAPLELSLDLLDALHARWVRWLRALPAEAFERRLDHPEWGNLDMDQMLQIYAWHGKHHVAHVTSLRERMGW